MLLIVNETTNDYKITRDGCTLTVSRKARKTETDPVTPAVTTITVSGLDARLDEMFKDKTYIKLAPGRTTKVFMTVADAVTTYNHVGSNLSVAALTRDAQEKDKDHAPYMRSALIIITDANSKSDTISLNDPAGCTDGVITVSEFHDTGEKSHILLVKCAKWAQISHKKVTVQINEKKTVHLSYVTVQKDGKDMNINALVRVDQSCKPVGKPINRKPIKTKKPMGKGGKRPYGKKPFNKNGGGNKGGYKKSYNKDGKQQGGYKKLFNKDGNSSGGYKKPYTGEKKSYNGNSRSSGSYNRDNSGKTFGSRPFANKSYGSSSNRSNSSSGKTYSKPKNYSK